MKANCSQKNNVSNDIVIDENTLRIFGWNQGVGKTLGYEKDGKILHSYRVVGVVRNFCYQPPTSIPGCIALQQPQAQNYLLFRASILFKFEEGSWHECRKAIEVMHKEDFPNAYLRLFNEEEEYDKVSPFGECFNEAVDFRIISLYSDLFVRNILIGYIIL